MSIRPSKFAVAIIVLRQNSEVEGGWEAVLVARKDDHTKWSLPGGKVDAWEESPRAAVRELGEETGIRVRPESLIPQGTIFDSGGYFTTFYLLDTTSLPIPETFTVEEEEAPVRWGPITDLLEGPYGQENYDRLQKLGVLK